MPPRECICGGAGWDGCVPDEHTDPATRLDGEAAHTRAIYEETLNALGRYAGGPGSHALYMQLLDAEAGSDPSSSTSGEVIDGRGRRVRPQGASPTNGSRPLALPAADDGDRTFIRRIVDGIANRPSPGTQEDGETHGN